jgi:hypothetical protein
VSGSYYTSEIDLASGERALLKELCSGTEIIVPIIPTTLEDLGLERLESGRIVARVE